MFNSPKDRAYEDIELTDLVTLGDTKACLSWLQQTRSGFHVELSDANLAYPVDRTAIFEIKGDIARITQLIHEVTALRSKKYNDFQRESKQRRREEEEARQEQDRLNRAQKRERHEAMVAEAREAKAIRQVEQLKRGDAFSRMFVDMVRIMHPEIYENTKQAIFVSNPELLHKD